jgi:hypothetical protein
MNLKNLMIDMPIIEVGDSTVIMSTESAAATTAAPIQETAPVKRKGRAKKATAENPAVKACRVPSLRTEMKSTLWAHHVHSIIKEFAPDSLKRDDVVDAFNAFVDCLAKHDDVFESYVPSKRKRYLVGFIYEKLKYQRYLDENIPARFKNEDQLWRNHQLSKVHNEIIQEMLQTYKVLYDLIKRDVIPPLEKVIHEEQVKRMGPIYRRDIEAYQTHMTKEEQRHEQTIASENERHKDIMDYLHKAMSHKIEDLRALMEDFKPTQFTD